MKKYKNHIIAGVIIILTLTATFVWGGNAPSTDRTTAPTDAPVAVVTSSAVATPSAVATTAPDATATPEMTASPAAKPTEAPQPIAAEPTPSPSPEAQNDELVCSISVSCHTILNNMSWLPPEKAGLVPADGVILKETSAVFYEGESVFNLLVREMKQNKIHLEFVNTPLYNSAYIEGIGNIYEFDCGELSGWMYKVNGKFPGYGSSQYILKNGDKIEWVYTCDLGYDVGDTSGTRNGLIKNE